MLKTLDKYINGAAPAGDLALLWSRIARDRRFALLLTISTVVHVIFYAAIIKLDSWAMMRALASRRNQVSIVKLTEIAPPPDRIAIRRAPESLERADISRLQFDPATADDIHLIQRSPKPTQQRGSSKLPTADLIEKQLRASRGRGTNSTPGTAGFQTAPPTTSSIQASRIPQLEELAIAKTPPTQAIPAPAPSPKPDVIASGSGSTDASPGTRRGSSSESAALGLEAARGQYMAYVRAKISKANERIMPREWIKDVLRDKVSADFALIIKSDGQILSTRLIRPSGYSVLDGYARQAIFSASPFEGFPLPAGNTITFTVTVYFFTL